MPNANHHEDPERRCSLRGKYQHTGWEQRPSSLQGPTATDKLPENPAQGHLEFGSLR